MIATSQRSLRFSAQNNRYTRMADTDAHSGEMLIKQPLHETLSKTRFGHEKKWAEQQVINEIFGVNSKMGDFRALH